MIKTIQSTKLRSNFKDALDHVKSSKEPLIVTERGVPTSVLVDIDAYEDYLSEHDPQLVASIQKSKKEAQKGEVYSFDDVFGDIN